MAQADMMTWTPFSLSCLLPAFVLLGCWPLHAQGVHLRTGHLEFLSSRSSQRHLLQSLSLGTSPGSSEKWGPFAGRPTLQLVLSLGEELAGSHDQQLQLLQHLHAHHAVVSGYLPPHAWLIVLVSTGDSAEVAERAAAGAPAGSSTSSTFMDSMAELFPSVELAVYGAPHKVAPEWQHVEERRQQHAARSAMHAAPGHREASVNKSMWAASSGSEAGMLLTQYQRDTRQYIGQVERADESGPDPRYLLSVAFCHVEDDDLARLRDAAAISVSASFEPSAAAAADWSTALAALTPSCMGGTTVTVELSSVVVATCGEDLTVVVNWIAEQPLVHWVQPKILTKLHNIYASTITQTGGLSSATNPLQSVTATHPFWQAGLDGTGQIIGCGDSGIDVDSCYFYDPEVSFLKGLTVKSNGYRVFSSTQHRKLSLYLGLAGDIVDAYGHGTHVTGTLAGISYSSPGWSTPDRPTGMAPGAKIAFMDLSSGNTDTVWPPSSLDRDYFPNTYAAGARIHSDSWGSQQTVYDNMAQAVDRYSWNNQDFLSIFAAGNYGADASGATSTVTSPANSKNCMAVGAAKSQMAQLAPQPDVVQMTLLVSVGNVQVTNATRLVVLQSSLGADFKSLFGSTLTLSAASPNTSCLTLGGAGIAGTVLVAQRGSCYAGSKLAVAQAAGALALLVTDNMAEGFFNDDNQGPSSASSLPMGYVPISTGRLLWAAVQTGVVGQVTFSAVTPTGQAYDDIADFSSFGPTQDGRIKPDIVAPSMLVSASTSEQDGSGVTGTPETCAHVTMQGTSMATPVVAGNAALVRQYFMSGFYPSAAADGNAKYTPSGVLVKAILMAGATPMLGNVAVSGGASVVPLEAPPSYRQGFGRADLARSLPLASSPLAAAGWRMQIVDLATLAVGEVHRYCVRATGAGPVVITLAWFDYPASPNARTVLVNNLDLRVQAASMQGAILLGNGVQDNVNTVEQVTLENVAPGNVAISVTASAVHSPAGKQPYALVVLGYFQGNLQSNFNPAVAAGGNASTGQCIINPAMVQTELSTPSMTSQRQVQFYFTTQSPTGSTAGFECRLTDDSGQTANWTGLHTWRKCVSPVTYAAVPDGFYVFAVRSTGEDVADVRTFAVDATPPVVTLSPSLASGSSTPSDNVTLLFNGTDMLPGVTFECILQLERGVPEVPPYLRLATGAAAPLDNWQPCTSPLTILGLSYGDWSFQVQGTDAVGNTALGPASSWKTRFSNGVDYARIASGVNGLTNQKLLNYTMYGFKGTAAGTPASLAAPSFQYSFSSSNTSEASLAWADSPSGSATVTTEEDGDYLFRARVAGSSDGSDSSTAVAAVTVDTTPPTVVIVSGPSPLQSNPSVTIKYTTEPAGDAQTFFARLLFSETATPDAATPTDQVPYVEYPGSVQATYTANVSSGFSLFQAQATDAAGNLSPPIALAFRNDLEGPSISMPPIVATQQRQVDLGFNLSYGPLGIEGVANQSCSMQLSFKVPNSGSSNTSNGYRVVDGKWYQNCTNPQKYAVVEGRYVFTVQIIDQALLKAQNSTVLIVDNTAPYTEVLTPPQPVGTQTPSQVTFTFSTLDGPDGSPSGVAYTECLLSNMIPPPPPPPMPPPSPRPSPPHPPAADASPPASSRSLLALTADERRRELLSHRGRLLSSSEASMVNGSAVAWNTWQQCPSPVTYINLPSGTFLFTARAVDAAGNIGNVSTPAYVLRVDASLPVDGPLGEVPTSSGGLSSTNIIIIAVVCGVGGALIIAVVLGIILYRRRVRRSQTYLVSQAPGANGHAPSNGHIPSNGNYGSPPLVGQAYVSNGQWQQQPQYIPPRPSEVELLRANSAAAIQASLAAAAEAAERERQREASRVQQAIQASLDEDNVRKAMAASLQATDVDELRLQAAIRASLATAPPTSAASPGVPSLGAGVALGVPAPMQPPTSPHYPGWDAFHQ